MQRRSAMPMLIKMQCRRHLSQKQTKNKRRLDMKELKLRVIAAQRRSLVVVSSRKSSNFHFEL